MAGVDSGRDAGRLDCPLQKTVEVLPTDGGASIRIGYLEPGRGQGGETKEGHNQVRYLIRTRPGNGYQHGPYRRDAMNGRRLARGPEPDDGRMKRISGCKDGCGSSSACRRGQIN